MKRVLQQSGEVIQGLKKVSRLCVDIGLGMVGVSFAEQYAASQCIPVVGVTAVIEFSQQAAALQGRDLAGHGFHRNTEYCSHILAT